MNLGDLLKKLYKRDDKIDQRELSGDAYDSTQEDQKHDEFEKFESTVLEKQTGDMLSQTQTKKRGWNFFVFGAVTIAILVGIILVIILYFKFIGSAFLEERISVQIDGASEVRSAEESSYTIKIVNGNRVGLEKSELVLEYPENMTIVDQPNILNESLNKSKIEVGPISAKGEKEFQVAFKPFGPRDRKVFLNATVRYQPKNFSSIFERKVQKSIVIKSSPISLTMIPVKQASSGEDVSLDIIVKNESSSAYGELVLRVDYPEGFVFKKAQPTPDREKGIWKITNIAAKEQVKISIDGSLEGPADSLKKFNASLGEERGENNFLVYTENEGIIKIIPSRVELIMKQDVENIYPGEPIRYTITFKNTSAVPLRDLILYQYIDSRLLNEKKISAKGGYFDAEKGAFFWKASDIPALKNLQPGEEGMVQSVIETLKVVPMNNENDRNFSVKAHAEIESLDVDSPLWANKRISSVEKETRVNSKLVVNVTAAYNDGELPNSGPIPLKVKEETTFTIRFSLLNTSNELKNTVLKTSMPSGIIWKESYLPANAGLKVNTRSNEIEWIIGTMDVGVGFFEPVKTLAFQVGIIPSMNQRDLAKDIKLLNEIKVTSLDSFSGEDVEYEFRSFQLGEVSDVNISIEE